MIYAGPLDATHEGLYKVLRQEPKYYIIDKNDHENASTDRFTAAYLEGKPLNVDFAAIPLKLDMNEVTTPQVTTNKQVEILKSSVALKATRSGRKKRFPEHERILYLIIYS